MMDNITTWHNYAEKVIIILVSSVYPLVHHRPGSTGKLFTAQMCQNCPVNLSVKEEIL